MTAPINTSSGKAKSTDLSSIIGINKIAPAGGKYILSLPSAKNKTVQARTVHTESGKPKNSFNNNLNKQPANALNVISPII